MRFFNMTRMIAVATVSAASLMAQIEIPAGTRVACRLEQQINSATAEEGQPVQLSVTENIMVNGAVVIAQGATVQGTITQAVPKRRMGRTGKLDFSVDKVRAVDGQYIPIRYTQLKKEGGSHGLRTGVLTAGAAVVFWPAAPVFLLMKGKDVNVNRGMVIDVFTDQSHVVSAVPTTGAPNAVASLGGRPTSSLGGGPQETTVTITADTEDAEIEVDGAFIGNAPSTRRMAAGTHQVVVRSGDRVWERTVQVQGGDNVTLRARLNTAQAAAPAMAPAPAPTPATRTLLRR